MPRKTKDKELEEVKTIETKRKTKATTTKKVAAKKAVSEKKDVSSKKEPTKKTTKPAKKTTVKKEEKKVASTKPKKAAQTARTVTKTKKATTTRKKTTTKNATSTNISLGEYYDLPNQYEQTLVKILAQTPTILFVYWDISAKDRQNLLNQYGENFFLETSPFLRIKNLTKNYEYEVEINDYANSWYLHIPDSDCEYEVILMRKNKNSQIIINDNGQMTIISSNQLETPNDHILFEKLGKNIFFQDIKTQKVHSKNIADFTFIQNIGRIYNIYDLYKEIYQNELNGDELGTRLSSSNFSSNLK
ncbi:MAG: DUF4912 domain-containing protein [Clostridia bacterium]|nr:DUF4912 domain-containing protein [Clostridia bacterium]